MRTYPLPCNSWASVIRGLLFPVVFYFLSLSTVNAQLPNYRHYTVDNGLNCSTIYKCIQDSKGFMWFATENGVMRFDGYFFDTFTKNHGLSDNEVFNVFEDSRGRIWFLTYNGRLSYYENGNIYNESQDSTLAACYVGNAFQYMFEDYYGNLWFSAMNGLLVFKSKDEARVIALPQQAMPAIHTFHARNSVALPIHSEKDSTLYIHFRDQVYQYDYKTGEAINPSSVPFLGNIIFNRKSKSHAYAVNLDKKIEYISGNKYKILPTVLQNDALWLERSENNTLIAYTNKTTYLIPDETLEPRCILKNVLVNYIFLDHQKNIWLCTRSEGIFHISQAGLNSAIWDKESGLSAQNVNSIYANDTRGIWLGLDNGMVAIIQNGSVKNVAYMKTSPVNSRATIILPFDDNTMLVGSDYGVDLISIDGKLSKKINEHNHHLGAVKSITADNDNYYTATSTGIFKISKSPPLKDMVQIQPTFQRRFVAFIDMAGNLWHCAQNGLYRSSLNNIDLQKDLVICPERIFKILELNDSTLLAASESAGLFIIKGDKVIDSISFNSSTKPIRCRDIFEIDNKLWVATNNGILKYERIENKWTQTGMVTKEEGLPTKEVNCVFIHNKQIYAGTTQGLVILPESVSRPNQTPISVYIRKISGSWGQSSDNNEVTLDYLHNNLNIEFSAITLLDNEFVTFNYKLNNNGEWNTAEGRNLALRELPYGTNEITLVGREKSGMLSSPIMLKVTVLAPIWRKPWAQTLAVILLIILITTLYYLWSKQRINEITQEYLVNLERSRISSDLHDDIGSDLTRINLLAELIGHAKDQEIITGTTKKIIAESRNLRYKADQIIWALTPENDNAENLMAYLHHYGLQFFQDTQISFHYENSISVNFNMSALKRRNIFLIVKEALNNSIKHASASNVWLRTSIFESTLIIKIEDDGRGIPDEANLPMDRSGLRNMKKRSLELGGQLFTENSSRNGLKVELRIPLKN